MTRQLIETGKVLDIEVVDHVITGRQTVVSMWEKGFAF